MLFPPGPSQDDPGQVESQKGDGVNQMEVKRGSAVCRLIERLSFDACLNRGKLEIVRSCLFLSETAPTL